MKVTPRHVGAAIALLCLAILVARLQRCAGEIPVFRWSPAATLVLFSAVTYSAFTVAVGAGVWLLMLRGAGASMSLRRACVILGQAQLAKYLPGNVFQYAGRASLAFQHGVSVEAIVASISAESFAAVVAAAGLTAAGLYFDGAAFSPMLADLGSPALPLRSLSTVLTVLLLAAAALALSPVRQSIRRCLARVSMGRIVVGAALYGGVFAGFGLFLSLLPDVLWAVHGNLHWYRFAWGYALAWVAGFLVPGAPAGLGIREVVLVWLYGPEIGQGIVIGLAFLLRMVTGLGDVLAFVLAWSLDRGPKV